MYGCTNLFHIINKKANHKAFSGNWDKRTKIFRNHVWVFWELRNQYLVIRITYNPFVKTNTLSIMSTFLPAFKDTLILYCMPVFYYLFKSILPWHLTEPTTDASKYPFFYRRSSIFQEFPPLHCQSVKLLPAFPLQLSWDIPFPVLSFPISLSRINYFCLGVLKAPCI